MPLIYKDHRQIDGNNFLLKRECSFHHHNNSKWSKSSFFIGHQVKSNQVKSNINVYDFII